MSRRKRPWGVIAAPIIFVTGLGMIWGVRRAEGVKHMVEGWGYEFEHTANPVTMDMPVYLPFFIDGDWVGELETVVVQRDRPGEVDALDVRVRMDDDELYRLDDCKLRLRITRHMDLGDFTRAVRCVRDTDGLAEFGEVTAVGRDITVPLLVRVGELPCDSHSKVHVGPCDHVDQDVQAELQKLGQDLRREARRIRSEAREIRNQVRAEVRAKVRGR